MGLDLQVHAVSSLKSQCPSQTTSKMRFAIIGTGAIGQEHLRNLLLMSNREGEDKSDQKVSVAALCDSTPLSLELAKGPVT